MMISMLGQLAPDATLLKPAVAMIEALQCFPFPPSSWLATLLAVLDGINFLHMTVFVRLLSSLILLVNSALRGTQAL
jgi:hypothetical protein